MMWPAEQKENDCRGTMAGFRLLLLAMDSRRHMPLGSLHCKTPEGYARSVFVTSAIISIPTAMSAIATCACSFSAPQSREVGRACTSRWSGLPQIMCNGMPSTCQAPSIRIKYMSS